MKNLTAYLAIIVRSVIYGSSVLFTGYLLQNNTVLDVLSLRFLLTFAFFVCLVAAGIVKVNYKGKPVRFLVAAAVFEPVLYFIFETIGIGGTTAVTAGMFIAVIPVMVAIGESLILKEKTTWMQKIFLLLGIAGIMLVTLASGSDSGTNTPIGMICMFLSVLSGALFIIYSRKSSASFSTMEITFFTTGVGAVVFNGINILLHLSQHTLGQYFASLLDAKAIGGFLFLSIGSSFVATCAGNYALSKIQASSVSALGGLSTIVTIVLGVCINHEQITPTMILAAIMILGGGMGINYIRVKQEQAAL